MFIRDRTLAVQAFGSTQPRDALRRLRYVVAQARTLASSGPMTLRALCDWLESRQREQYYDAESPLPDLDENAVRFMTVHGSKGQEFPIVILTGLGVASSRAGPQSVDLVPDYHSDVLNIRCGDFVTRGYARDTEKTMYEAEQRRLLYVATTRARDHLVLSVFHGKDPCHATRILERLATGRELSRESSLDERSASSAASVSALPLSSIAPHAPESPNSTNAQTPDQHRADEETWLAHRESLITRLANQAIIAPSRLSHDIEPAPAPDPPPEPDPQSYVRRTAKGRGATALGCAVHAVLQLIDLATLENLDALATAAARDENIPDVVQTIAQYVQNAAASAPVQEAIASGRYWREVPLGITWNDGEILEGAVDLLYATADGSLHVVDYKTDHISEAQMTTRSEEYRRQGEAYAIAVERTTGQQVRAIHFIFAALARTSSIMRTAAHPAREESVR